MDGTTELLSTYALDLDYSHLPPETIHETKRRIIDSMGCAMGGFASEPASIARHMAATTTSASPSRVLGSGERTSPEMAAFTNTVMVRYLDFNDTFASPGAGHPSDMLPAVLAVADPWHASGKEVITATVLAYEIYGRLADQVALGERGWDQGIFAVLGSACAAGKVVGLSQRQMAHAISLAIVPNLPLNQTRVGELGMWKGCATAAATRNGVFAALLAREGMEGPYEPFEGRYGLWEQATGPITIGDWGGVAIPFKLNETSLKYFPSQIHTQGPISIALELRKMVSVEEIQAINVETYDTAWRTAGNEPEKWDPQTRETADHSLPYLISVALRDGPITPASFTADRVGDPGLRSLMQKVAIKENQEFTRRYPEAQVSQIEVVTWSGRRITERVCYPKGHRRNPLTDGELEDKFQNLAKTALTPQIRRRSLEVMWKLEEVENVGRLLDLLQTSADSVS